MILRLLAALTLAVAAHPAYAQTPGSSPCTTQFNLSNGYEITWAS